MEELYSRINIMYEEFLTYDKRMTELTTNFNLDDKQKNFGAMVADRELVDICKKLKLQTANSLLDEISKFKKLVKELLPEEINIIEKEVQDYINENASQLQ